MSDLSSPAANRKQTKRLRFGSWVLFYVTAVVAAAIALLGIAGLIWAGLVIGFWLMRVRKNKNEQKLVEFLIVVAVIGILIGMVLPPVTRRGGLSAAAGYQRNQMRQICLAVFNYESAYGHFPPAYIADENGKPMHSWRVLILPFLEQNAVYDQYDFDEPWDGPNNSKLVDKLGLSSFSARYDQGDNLTGFKLVTGTGTGFDKDQSSDYGELLAGSSNTIMLVQDNMKPVNWMSPEDLPIDEVVKIFDYKNKMANVSRVEESKFQKTKYYFSNVGMFDGSTLSTGFLKDPSVMREHFTIETCPKIPLEKVGFELVRSENEVKLEGYILVAANFLLAVLPAFGIKKTV